MENGRKVKGEVYTIISGTDRVNSHSRIVAEIYKEVLCSKGIHPLFFSMENFNPLKDEEAFKKAQDELLIPATKFVFVIPEYNGSYPGVLKAMIDRTDPRAVWYYKKALLTGVSTGRAGNLRGMDHLADTLNFMRMTVHYNKLPISKVDHLLDADGHLDEVTMSVIDRQVDEFIIF
ncbi:MAG: NAD(P)H-dependent oxidoreductase [Chitinophagaceae bacterium]|nr:NAD(P)H-dependent oxidoreductase [Chitinophagaceae bacterium]MCW5915590.1 NAD(P)H-dependent oxidoreductase [Chitinophagaceae bacterium]MCZ2397498.1 NAD(P)H-dependent oxidoreductase [Chitinophagales bacterium]